MAYYDVVSGMKFSWEKFRTKQLVKWAGFYLAGIFIASLVDLAILLLLATVLMGANNIDLAQALQKIPNISIVTMIAGLWLLPRFMRAAMEVNEVKIAPKPPSMLNWAVLNIRKCLLDIFCWYDKKLLAPAMSLLAVALAIFAIGNIASIPMLKAPSLFIAWIGFVAWAIAIFAHSLRTHFSLYMYLRGDGKEGEMPKKSFDLIKGQTFEVFLARLLFAIAVLIAIVVIAIALFAILLIPCAGVIIDFIAILVLLVALCAFCEAFDTNMFKFFDKAGPVLKKARQGKIGAKQKKAGKRKKAKKR